MKAISGLLMMVATMLSGCTSNELNKEKAARLLRQEIQYPKIYDYEINRVDPESAKKLINAGLEEKGLVTVNRKQKIADIGKPLIFFASKAKPYLLTLPAGKNPDNVQEVKIADIDLKDITGIKVDGKIAVVDYTLSYQNITPFAVLVALKPDNPAMHKATFSLYDDGWHLVKK